MCAHFIGAPQTGITIAPYRLGKGAIAFQAKEVYSGPIVGIIIDNPGGQRENRGICGWEPPSMGEGDISTRLVSFFFLLRLDCFSSHGLFLLIS